MKINSQSAKRLGIFFFYDKQGIADRYIEYLLKSIRNSLETLYVVVNGNLSSDSHELFDKYASKVIVRENVGFDVWAYKTAIEDIGWDQIVEYDEMIMFNFTIFGPFYPFEDMFKKMDKKDLDFWGITKHYSLTNDTYWKDYTDSIPMHIQSHFIVIRKDMLQNPIFKEYWVNMPHINNYKEAVCLHEAKFTKYFSDAGFKWDVYIDSDDLKKSTPYPLMVYPFEMLKKGCPIVKRKNFFMDYMENFRYGTYGEGTDQILDFIEKNTDYDSSLIWENILRTNPLSSIKDCMHLNYIIDEQTEAGIDDSIHAALFCHITDLNSKNILVPYLNNVSMRCEIYVFSLYGQEQLTEYFGDLHVDYILVGLKSVTDILSKLAKVLEEKGYSIAGFISDCTFSNDRESLLRICRNMLFSATFINAIKRTFDKNESLACLTTPLEYHGDKIGNNNKEWLQVYNDIEMLKNTMNLKVELSKEASPIYATNNSGWFRSSTLLSAIKQILNYHISDKFDLKYLFPLIVQSYGSCFAYVFSRKEAMREITNLYFMLDKILLILDNKANIDWFGDVIYYLDDSAKLIDDLKKQINGKNQYESKLENELKELKKYEKTQEDELKELKKYEKTQEDELKELKEYEKSLEDELKELKKYTESCEDELKNTKDFLYKIEKEIKEKQEKNARLIRELKKNKEKNLELKQKSDQLEQELSDRGKEIDKLEKDIHDVSSYAVGIRSDLKNLEMKYRVTEEEIARKDRKIETLILELLEKENELDRVYNSKSWKVTKIFRKNK